MCLLLSGCLGLAPAGERQIFGHHGVGQILAIGEDPRQANHLTRHQGAIEGEHVALRRVTAGFLAQQFDTTARRRAGHLNVVPTGAAATALGLQLDHGTAGTGQSQSAAGLVDGAHELSCNVGTRLLRSGTCARALAIGLEVCRHDSVADGLASQTRNRQHLACGELARDFENIEGTG